MPPGRDVLGSGTSAARLPHLLRAPSLARYHAFEHGAHGQDGA